MPPVDVVLFAASGQAGLLANFLAGRVRELVAIPVNRDEWTNPATPQLVLHEAVRMLRPYLERRFYVVIAVDDARMGVRLYQELLAAGEDGRRILVCFFGSPDTSPFEHLEERYRDQQLAWFDFRSGDTNRELDAVLRVVAAPAMPGPAVPPAYRQRAVPMATAMGAFLILTVLVALSVAVWSRPPGLDSAGASLSRLAAAVEPAVWAATRVVFIGALGVSVVRHAIELLAAMWLVRAIRDDHRTDTGENLPA